MVGPKSPSRFIRFSMSTRKIAKDTSGARAAFSSRAASSRWFRSPGAARFLVAADAGGVANSASGASAAENSAPLLGTARDTEETGTTLFVPGTVRSDDDADSHREIVETRPRRFVAATRGASRASVETAANIAVSEGCSVERLGRDVRRALVSLTTPRSRVGKVTFWQISFAFHVTITTRNR